MIVLLEFLLNQELCFQVKIYARIFLWPELASLIMDSGHLACIDEGI